MSVYQLDPRWEWVTIETYDGELVAHHRVGCNHLEVAPVETIDGEIVAHLCLTCDSQLP